MDSRTILGVVCGLMAAFCQTLSYLATRHFVQRRPAGASRLLLVLAHVWMGVWAAALIPFFWPAGGLPREAWLGSPELGPGMLWPLVAITVCYLLGQMGLMMALKRTEPSRISPLLGFKIVILAVMTVTIGPAGSWIGPLQWAGVGLCVVAAVGLNYAGGRMPTSAVLAVLFSCVAYSLSDWHITMLVASTHRMMGLGPDDPVTRAAVLAACLTYAASGLVALVFLPWFGTRRMRDWRGSIPFGAAWFFAMLFLYGSFSLTNVVFGNILQSTRGLMSVVIGSILTSYGLLHLEPETGRGVFARRLAAAALMFLAVVLYLSGMPVKR